jgi:hypothetical protein
MKNRLLYLATGEFVAICMFVIIYNLFNSGIASLASFLFLLFILLQGSLYWFYRYILIIKRKTVSYKAIKTLSIFRKLNIALAIVIPIIIIKSRVNYNDLLIAIVLYFFSIIEFINYYWYRLSYGKSGFNMIILLNVGLQMTIFHS